jgi:uncharacterized protein with HEPN domain
MPAKSSLSNSHSQEAYLQDVLESAQLVLRYMAGVTFDAFWDDGEKRDAVSMRLSVIGEAARHLTKDTEAQLQEVPFKDIRGMRNRIAHDYGRVDYRIVWEVTQKDILPLVTAVERYFAQRNSAPLPQPSTPPTANRGRKQRR